MAAHHDIYDRFCRDLPLLIAQGQKGKWAVVTVSGIHSLWDTYELGLHAAYDQIGLEGWLLQEVDDNPQPKYFSREPVPMDKPSCFLALPSYGLVNPQALFSVMACGQKLAVLPIGHKMSDIDSNYTSLLCMALNGEVSFDYFAMLHSDVEPEPGWLDTLYDEMQTSGADILSAVIPIKNPNGVTSTGMGRTGSRKVKRLTMTEVFDLPATFNWQVFPLALKDRVEHYLAVNTGCMLWKRNRERDWWRDFAKQGGFHHEHWVEEDADGKLKSWMFPEDWNMSRWAAAKGLTVCATRKVRVKHHGEMAFGNASVWGEWQTDQDFRGY